MADGEPTHVFVGDAERYQRIRASGIVGIADFDESGRILEANDTFLEMIGRTHAELQAGLLRWDQLTPPEWLPRTRQALQEFAETGRIQPYEKEYSRSNGQRFWGLFAGARLGRSNRGVAMVLDITERKRAQRALHESEERYRAIVSQAATGVALAKPNGEFVFVNQFYCDLTGYSSDELLQLRMQDITHPDDLARGIELFEQLAVTGQPFDIEKRYVRKDGTAIWVHNGLSAIRDPAGQPHRVLAMTVDITARKLAEDALREANERKDNFLATLAHELRNPLAPIRSALSILRSTCGNDPATQRVHEMMQRQLLHMVRLVDDLLEVSRITRGSVELRRERVDLADIVHSAVETSRPLIEQAGHELVLQLPQQPLPVHADPMRLAQVLANVLNNAAKFTPSGGSAGAPPGRIELRARSDGGRAMVSVRDNGVGIEPHMLQRMFDMFTQARPGLGGLGIGLGLARSLLQLHDGDITARSDGPGRGSEFVITLPLAPAAPAVAAATAPRPAVARAAPPPVSRRVLVVDDNRDAAESLAMLLQMDGTDAHAVYDGQAALDLVGRLRPDVVVLDLGMPGLDGYEVARRLRARQPHGRPTLIALSGWGKDEDRQRSRAAGFDHHLIKPVGIEVLQQLLHEPAPAAPANEPHPGQPA